MPAGTVHCSLRDWARFVDWAMTMDEPLPLSAPSRARMRESVDGIVPGWVLRERADMPGTLLTASGSNTQWRAEVWAAPAERRAILAVANADTPQASEAIQRVLAFLAHH